LKRGEVVKIETVQSFLVNVITASKNRLLAIPGTVGKALSGANGYADPEIADIDEEGDDNGNT
jgi:hypothetical protein